MDELLYHKIKRNRTTTCRYVADYSFYYITKLKETEPQLLLKKKRLILHYITKLKETEPQQSSENKNCNCDYITKLKETEPQPTNAITEPSTLIISQN